MRDSEKGWKKPIEAVEKLRAHKAKLERISPVTKKPKKVEEPLQAAEDLYGAVMENTFFGFTLIDRDYKIVLVNSLMCKYFHKPASGLIGKKCFREFEKRDSICSHCPGTRAMATGQPSEVETEKVRDNGSRFLACIQAFPTLDSDGAVTGFIEIAEDISERKKAEQALRASRDYLERLTNSMGDAVFSVKIPDRVIEWANDSFKLIGYEPDECVGKTTEFLYPSKSEFLDFGNKLASAIESGKDILHAEQSLKRKNGEVFPADITTTIFREEGEVVRVTSIIRDITERKKAEEQIEKLARFPEENSSPVYRVSKDGVLLYANPASRRLILEYQTKIGDKIPEKWIGMIKNVYDSGTRQQVEMELNGRIFLFEQVPVIEGGYVNSYAIDITERKKIEEMLSAAIYKSAIPTAVGESDGSIIAFNEALETLIGYKMSEVSDITDWANKLYPDKKYREFVWKNIKQALEGRKQDCTEFTITCKDGSTKVVDFHTTFFKGGLVIQMQDITESKKAEQELIQQHNLLRLLIDNLPDRVYVKDCKSRFVIGNDAVVKYEGVQSEKELLGKTDFDLYPKELAAYFYAKEQQVIQKGRPMINEEELWTDKHGNEQWLLTTKIPLRDENGEILGLVGINRNITERKKMEQQLKDAFNLNQIIIDTSPVGIWIFEESGQFVMFNQSGVALSGGTAEQLLKLNFRELESWKRSGLLQAAEEALLTGKLVKKEIHAVNTFNTEVWYEALLSTIRFKGKKHLLLTTYDIKDMKHSEEALRETTQTLQAVIQASPLPICTLDRERIVKTWNPAAERTFGWSAQEVIGRKYPAIPKEKIGEADALFSRALESGLTEVEAIRQRKDGSLIDVSISAAPLRDSRGNINGVMAVVADITERKKASEALALSESRFRALVEHLPKKIFIKDRNSVYLFSNQNYAQDLKIAPEEIIGKTDYDFFPKELAEKYLSDDKRIIETGKTEDIEEKYIENGKERWVDTVKTPYKDGEGNIIGVLGIFRDITERKKVDQKIYDYQQQLKALSYQLLLIEERAKRKIAAGLHDNIGQKLATAKLELQSLMRSSPDTKMSDSINSICWEITHVMDDVRSLTFELGNPLLDKIGLTAALERYITEEIQAKFGIKCELNDEAGAQDLEETVRTVLYRSIRELLINAVKHARAHNMKVCIYQSAGLPPRLPTRVGAAGNIHVCVEDDGVGFDVSKIALLPTKTGGFGLFSIKEQLEYIGGNLQVESRVGHGTKVTIGCHPKLK